MSGFKSDHQLVRDYVTAMDHVRESLISFLINLICLFQLQYTQLPEDVVAITMTHSNIPTKHVDLRLNLHLTVSLIDLCLVEVM